MSPMQMYLYAIRRFQRDGYEMVTDDDPVSQTFGFWAVKHLPDGQVLRFARAISSRDVRMHTDELTPEERALFSSPAGRQWILDTPRF